MQVAVEFNIPLIIWGAHQGIDQVGMFSHLDEVEMMTGLEFKRIDIAVPEIFVGGLLGSMTVFVFSAWSIRAVGNAAEDVIKEVRRQFRDHPGILDYKEKHL